MYNIDWEKYLSTERFRESNSQVGKGVDRRSAFDSDLGRVIFCYALRRMHDKTQVVPLSNGDTYLTRLTHSLQVMNVAESLASNFTRTDEFKRMYPGKSEEYSASISAILRSAALIHDIGNPPFGHFGEVTIQKYFEDINIRFPSIDHREALDFTEFDGNALGLRMVSKLQYTGTLDGLNLTYATMATYLKYPNDAGKNKDGYIGYHKHGIFKTEELLFRNIVKSCHMNRANGSVKRHPLAFLLEAADSICYGTMDIEDGYNMKLYSFDELVGFIDSYVSENSKSEMKLKYLKDSSNVNSFSIEMLLNFKREWNDGTEKDFRRIILDFRVKLITYLVNVATKTFISNLDKIDSGEYDSELLKDDELHISEALSAFTFRYIISQHSVQQIEMTGCSVIRGLLDILIEYAFNSDEKYSSKIKGVIAKSRLQEIIHESVHRNMDICNIDSDELFDFDFRKLNDYTKLRLIVDFVGSMTDKFSVEIYQKLSGIKI